MGTVRIFVLVSPLAELQRNVTAHSLRSMETNQQHSILAFLTV